MDQSKPRRYLTGATDIINTKLGLVPKAAYQSVEDGSNRAQKASNLSEQSPSEKEIQRKITRGENILNGNEIIKSDDDLLSLATLSVNKPEESKRVGAYLQSEIFKTPYQGSSYRSDEHFVQLAFETAPHRREFLIQAMQNPNFSSPSQRMQVYLKDIVQAHAADDPEFLKAAIQAKTFKGLGLDQNLSRRSPEALSTILHAVQDMPEEYPLPFLMDPAFAQLPNYKDVVEKRVQMNIKGDDYSFLLADSPIANADVTKPLRNKVLDAFLKTDVSTANPARLGVLRDLLRDPSSLDEAGQQKLAKIFIRYEEYAGAHPEWALSRFFYSDTIKYLQYSPITSDALGMIASKVSNPELLTHPLVALSRAWQREADPVRQSHILSIFEDLKNEKTKPAVKDFITQQINQIHAWMQGEPIKKTNAFELSRSGRDYILKERAADGTMKERLHFEAGQKDYDALIFGTGPLSLDQRFSFAAATENPRQLVGWALQPKGQNQEAAVKWILDHAPVSRGIMNDLLLKAKRRGSSYLVDDLSAEILEKKLYRQSDIDLARHLAFTDRKRGVGEPVRDAIQKLRKGGSLDDVDAFHIIQNGEFADIQQALKHGHWATPDSETFFRNQLHYGIENGYLSSHRMGKHSLSQMRALETELKVPNEDIGSNCMLSTLRMFMVKPK